MAHPQLTFSYFNFAGRGELTRLVLHYGGISFVSERVDFAEFGGIKPTLPLGQLPALEVDRETFAQSLAIARYAAKLAGLYPTKPIDAVRVDMIVDTADEIRGVVIDIDNREKDPVVKGDKTEKFLGETLPKALKSLEGMVQGKFFLGDAVTLADLQFFDVVTNKVQRALPIFDNKELPKLSAVVARVKAIPTIAAYLANP